MCTLHSHHCKHLPISLFGGVGATRAGALGFSGVGCDVTGREIGSVAAGGDAAWGTGMGAKPKEY